MRAASGAASWGRRRVVESILFYAGLGAILVPFLFPPVWMVLASLKTQAQNIAVPPVWFFRPTLANYRAVFANNPFAEYFLNSLVVGVGSTGLGLLVGLPAAYSIAKYRQEGLALGILVIRMVPGMAYLIPWYIVFSRLELIGTHLALILTHLTITLPFTIWLMIGFFEDLPAEVTDAALIDGCSEIGTFFRIAVPLTLPGAAVAAIFAFTYSWNNFLLSLIIGGLRTRTLPVAVYNFMSYGFVEWGGIMAGATVVTLPVLLLILVIQKQIAGGLTLGAVKG